MSGAYSNGNRIMEHWKITASRTYEVINREIRE